MSPTPLPLYCAWSPMKLAYGGEKCIHVKVSPEHSRTWKQQESFAGSWFALLSFFFFLLPYDDLWNSTSWEKTPKGVGLRVLRVERVLPPPTNLSTHPHICDCKEKAAKQRWVARREPSPAAPWQWMPLQGRSIRGRMDGRGVVAALGDRAVKANNRQDSVGFDQHPHPTP